MANRKRNIQMKFYVTEDEKRLIDEKMSQLPTRRYGAYLRKMAIDGYIIYTDTADIKAFTKELSAIGRNINQIAKRINAGGPAYQADMDEIRERLDEILAKRNRVDCFQKFRGQQHIHVLCQIPPPQIIQIVDIGLKYEIVDVGRKLLELLRRCQLERRCLHCRQQFPVLRGEGSHRRPHFG